MTIVPSTNAPAKVTQARYPWRATLRTIAAAVLALLPILPELIDVLGLRAYAWAAGFLAVVAAVTRVLAMPSVIRWLQTYLPALAPAPKPLDPDLPQMPLER